MTATDGLQLTDFQQRVLSVPEEFDLFLGGGRGGGKSFTLALLALRHCEQYREKARVLFVRQTLPGTQDFLAICRELFGQVYGNIASYNSSSHVWTLPTDSYFEIGMLADERDYQRYQGRSFSLLLIDEAGQFGEPSLLDLLRSNLRAAGVPVRVAMASNPAGPGHAWLAKRHVFRAAPFVPYTEPETGREWVTAPSTYLVNSFLDRDQYRRQIEAATATDDELAKAWLTGDWAVARGAYFATVLDESRNCIDPWPVPEKRPAGSQPRELENYEYDLWG